MAEKKYQVVIVGGGSAGISVAATLVKTGNGRELDIAIVDPAEHHYYQPAFTLVGAGCYSLEKTRREMQSLVPANVELIRDSARSFDPENNSLVLGEGDTLSYDYLVLCPGLELNWDKIAGAREAIGEGQVCSNYSPQHVDYTWDCIRQLKSGSRVVFTQAPLPFKCPGAPQKIAYLTADYLDKKNLLGECELNFLTHAPGIFGVPFFARELNKVADRYGIKRYFQHNLVKINAASKIAEFELVGEEDQGKTVEMEYDMLHFTPPQSPPEVFKSSAFANDSGYIDVHQNSLQHTKYSNVFALGDAASTPNSKTAAAVRKQTPVVVHNILAMMKSGELSEAYDGYASCPLTTAFGKVILAEFCYGGKVTPSFPLDPARERWTYWWIKATGFPIFYWNYMLKGHTWFLDHDRDFVEP